MRARRLSELVDLMQPAAVEVVGEDAVAGPDVVIDNRVATPGSLFVAIPGARSMVMHTLVRLPPPGPQLCSATM